MTLELLFPHFDELIRTPEDVQRLNEAILQLAVQGKLVPQDPEDEPAGELLRRIDQPKASLPSLEPREAPFAAPLSWAWVRLGNLADVVSGVTLGRNLANYETTSLPYLRVANVQRGYLDLPEIKMVEVKTDEKDKYLLQAGDLLLTEGGDSDKLGRAAIWHDQIPVCIHQNHIFRARPLGATPAEWLMLCTNSPYGRDYFLGSSKKTTNLASINSTQLKNCPIALPPIAEQQRILAKVEELFAQTRALEAKLRQAQADIVTANRAALHRLHRAQDDGQFQAAWRTLRDHFDLLYDDPRNVADLRQAILDLAVRGKLVAQDAEDEPAGGLLKRIEAEKKRLVEDKKLEKSKPMVPIKVRETSFELPNGWRWSRLGDLLLEIQTGPFGSMLHKSDYVDGGVPVINPANIRDGRIEPLANMAVSEDTKTRLGRYVLEEGDIVMGRRGEMGRCAVVTQREAGWLCGSGSFNLKTSANMSQEYLVRLIRSPGARRYLSGGSVGSTMSNLNHRILGQMVVGVPPLAEQHRIVAKVDQLMRLCDALQAGLVQAEVQRRGLTAAVLSGICREAAESPV